MLGHQEGRAQRPLYDMCQTDRPVSGSHSKVWIRILCMEGAENWSLATKKAKKSVVIGIRPFVGRLIVDSYLPELSFDFGVYILFSPANCGRRISSTNGNLRLLPRFPSPWFLLPCLWLSNTDSDPVSKVKHHPTLCAPSWVSTVFANRCQLDHHFFHFTSDVPSDRTSLRLSEKPIADHADMKLK